jgi:hypothetical protein
LTPIGNRACLALAIRLAGLAMVFTALSSSARADDGSMSDPALADKSGYSFFDPTPDDLMRKFTPDRPTKGFSVRTVDAGHFELESDIINYTYSRYLGVTTRSLEALDPDLKIGVTNWADVEVQFNGLQSLRSFESESGAALANVVGFGDVFLRTKMNLFGNDAGPVGLAIIPYVKLPSSVPDMKLPSSVPVISNGAVEGGLIAPLALRLPQDYIVTLMTEVDALKNSDNDRRFTNFVNLVGVSHPVPGVDGANVMAELYSSAGTDPATPPIYTFDLGTNLRVNEHTILDLGLNLGLNNAAPKAQIYTGISVRF